MTKKAKEKPQEEPKEATLTPSEVAEVLEPSLEVLEAIERLEQESHADYIQRMYAKWKEDWPNDVTVQVRQGNGSVTKVVTPDEQRLEFFRHCTTPDIVAMTRLDDDNPLTMLDKLDGWMSSGILPALGSLRTIMTAYRGAKPELVEEVARAVRRGKLKEIDGERLG